MGGTETQAEERTEQDSDKELEPGQELENQEDTADVSEPKAQEQEGDEAAESVEEQPDLPEGWFDHPAAIEAFDKARDEGISSTQSGKDKEMRKLEVSIKERETVAANEAAASTIVAKASSVIADVGERLAEIHGEEDAQKILGRLLGPYNGWARIYSDGEAKRQTTQGFSDGFETAAKALTKGELPKAIAEELSDFQDELADKLKIGRTPGLTAETVLDQIRDRRDELMRSDATAKNESKREHREEVTENLSNRGKPPAGIGGRGKTRGPDGLTREKIEEMSTEAISKLPIEDLERAMSIP